MWVLSLGQEDALEEEIATHSSIFFFFLKNPIKGGAWWVKVHRVTKSWT